MFDALTRWVSGDEVAEEAVARLVEAGVIDSGRPHEALVAGLEAVTGSVCRLHVEVRDEAGELERANCWVSGGAAALLVDLPGGMRREFLTVHPTFLPGALARLLGLGPRPRLDAQPLTVPEPLFDRLLDPDADQRQAALPVLLADNEDEQVAATAQALVTGSRRAWSVQVEWQTRQDQPQQRTLKVLDTEAGLWLVEPGPTGPAMWPATATTVWRALVLLLPRDDELA